jgi:hypothetical protein
MTERLSKQVEILRRLIAESYQRPNTIKRIESIISTSRQLKNKSLASLETSLDRLWQDADMAQARLDVAQQQVLAMQQQSRAGFLKRIAAGPD